MDPELHLARNVHLDIKPNNEIQNTNKCEHMLV